MKADELPEETNNPKPQESGEINPPTLSSLSESPLTSDTSASPINPEELIIPQDASTPEKVPIIESQNSELEGENTPPELVSQAVNAQRDKEDKGDKGELEEREETRLESAASPIDATVSPFDAIETKSVSLENKAITPEQTQTHKEDISVGANQSTSWQQAQESLESETYPIDATVSPFDAIETKSVSLENKAITPEKTQTHKEDIAVDTNQSTSWKQAQESQENIENLSTTEDKQDKGELEEVEAASYQPMAVAQNANEETVLESEPDPTDATVSLVDAIETKSSNEETQAITPEQNQTHKEDIFVSTNQSISWEQAQQSLESEPDPTDATVSLVDAIETKSSNQETQAITSEQNQTHKEEDIAVNINQSTRWKQEQENQEKIDNLSFASATPIDAENAPMRIFITGASGCIGHYIVETLIEKTDYELYLLVRNPNQLKFDCNARPGIHIVQGDMREIKRFSKLLKTMNCAVLAAAAWGGQEAIDVNVFKTIELLNLLNPKVCQHVIYFSTASVLNRQNKLLKEAGQAGTDYIRSKYDFLRQVTRVPIAKRITTVFPTLVLGGDQKHPYSHVSGGLPDLMKETEILRFFNKPLLKVKPIDLIRFFQADGSFHFIHARDIAQVVRYLIDHPPESQDSRWLVLGNEPVTLNEVIEEACAYLNKPITRRFNLSPWIANIFIRLFRIQMSAWDRFSFEYRHFTYQNPVNPSTFGMPVYCPELIDVLKLSGISRRG